MRLLSIYNSKHLSKWLQFPNDNARLNEKIKQLRRTRSGFKSAFTKHITKLIPVTTSKHITKLIPITTSKLKFCYQGNK